METLAKSEAYMRRFYNTEMFGKYNAEKHTEDIEITSYKTSPNKKE